MRIRDNSGFTLVEIIVVAAIIAVLAGVLIPMIFSQIDEAKLARTEADIKSLSTAILTFRKDVGTWPVNAEPDCASTVLRSSAADFPATMSAAMTAAGYDMTSVKTFSSQLTNDPECYNNWNGPYMPFADADPWGNPYFVYTKNFNTSSAVHVVSAGPDGGVNTLPGADTVSPADIGIRIQ